MDVKKIVLITTGQPAANPRIAKEADALSAAGFRVTMLYCYYFEWAAKMDNEILKNALWQHECVGYSPSSGKWKYFFTRVRSKANNFLSKIFGNQFLLAERTQARCYDELLQAAKAIKADWYIGHNLGALPVVTRAARYNHAKCGFDFEDYHRGETTNPVVVSRVKYLEEKYVDQLDYFSTSSALITELCKQNFPAFKGQVTTLRNSFYVKQQPPFRQEPNAGNTLRLFWFSQTIGMNRGLEIIFDAIEKLKDPGISLTIAGNMTVDIENYIQQKMPSQKRSIHHAGVISSSFLPAFASRFDVGLSIEPTTPQNRNVCLTNKIFTYLLAGNAIIFSSTKMQQAFNEEYNAGEMFTTSDELIEKILLYKDRSILNRQRKHNYELASQELNWEMESKKFLALFA